MATDKDLTEITTTTTLDAADLVYLVRDPSGTPVDKAISGANLASQVMGDTTLKDVGDVSIADIASGEILKWDGSSWVNNTLAEAGIAATGHVHAAADITSGTLAHERGGLESDVSGFGGLVKITGGATSQVTDNSSNWNAAFTHVSSDGSDHTFLDQDVRSSASPTFVGPLVQNLTLLNTDASYSNLFTTINANADWYGSIKPTSTVDSGIHIRGASDSANLAGLQIDGYVGSTTPSIAPLVLRGFKWDGVSTTAAVGNAEKVLSLLNATTEVLSVKGNGDLSTSGSVTGTSLVDSSITGGTPLAYIDSSGALVSVSGSSVTGNRVALSYDATNNGRTLDISGTVDFGFAGKSYSSALRIAPTLSGLNGTQNIYLLDIRPSVLSSSDRIVRVGTDALGTVFEIIGNGQVEITPTIFQQSGQALEVRPTIDNAFAVRTTDALLVNPTYQQMAGGSTTHVVRFAEASTNVFRIVQQGDIIMSPISGLVDITGSTQVSTSVGVGTTPTGVAGGLNIAGDLTIESITGGTPLAYIDSSGTLVGVAGTNTSTSIISVNGVGSTVYALHVIGEGGGSHRVPFACYRKTASIASQISAWFSDVGGTKVQVAQVLADGTMQSSGDISRTGYDRMLASIVTDTAPADDTTQKKLSLQKLAAPPTNAAYIAFSNNPGTDTFYLVLEEGS